MRKLALVLFFIVFATAAYAFGTSDASLSKGAKPQDFTLSDVSGKKVSLSDYKGKVVVLNFWATWCPPCRGEMPEFDAMDKEFKASGEAVLLAVNMTDGKRETPKKVAKFISENGYGLRVLLDTEGKAANIFSIQYLPTTYVLTPDGKVSGQLVGGTTKEAVMNLVRKAK